jgi:hypothetical protein
MHSSDTLSQLHISRHSFVMMKVLIVMKVIGRAFKAQPSVSGDFSPSLCPLL